MDYVGIATIQNTEVPYDKVKNNKNNPNLIYLIPLSILIFL